MKELDAVTSFIAAAAAASKQFSTGQKQQQQSLMLQQGRLIGMWFIAAGSAAPIALLLVHDLQDWQPSTADRVCQWLKCE
jgi:hypothetical protein